VVFHGGQQLLTGSNNGLSSVVVAFRELKAVLLQVFHVAMMKMNRTIANRPLLIFPGNVTLETVRRV